MLLKDIPPRRNDWIAFGGFTPARRRSPALVSKLVAGISSEPPTGPEVEVHSLLASGKSNKETGANHCISETTVKTNQCLSIFGKLKVLGRTEAIAVVHRRGPNQLQSHPECRSDLRPQIDFLNF